MGLKLSQYISILGLVLSTTLEVLGQKNGNPIVPYVGMADPHIFIYNNKAYLYATRDVDSIQTKTKFVMPDWHIWSSDDLIHWSHDRVISPEETYMGKSTSCWATDMGVRNDKYYFYFSNGNQTTGVMVSDKPEGPFVDALSKPMLDTTLTTSKEYDPSILTDDDANKTPYIIFGHHRDDDPKLGYYIAKLNDDMISLKTAPVKVVFTGNHTYLAGNDKPNLHKHNGWYYLSAGSHYAISKNIYGPYEKIGNSGNNNYGLTPQAHGNYFSWKNQWFHTWCKFHLTKEVARYRESYITYLHYKKNGEMVSDTVLLRDHFANGVGQYDANWDKIEAEWYMATDLLRKNDFAGGFEINDIANKGFLSYPNVRNVAENAILRLRMKQLGIGELVVKENDANGIILGKLKILGNKKSGYEDLEIQLTNSSGNKNLYLEFVSSSSKPIASLDWIALAKNPKTNVKIVGNTFLINGQPTYKGRYWKGKKIEGLLMNSRMVQGIFDDLNAANKAEFAYPDTKVWDPERNNQEFINALQEWKAFGLNSFTINIQGGSPYGYGNKKAYNPGFYPDGSLRADYMGRLAKIIDRADELNMVVILGMFYFGQDQHLTDEKAVKNAVINVTNWLHDRKYRNVIIEIANESSYKVPYDHAIIRQDRAHELITLSKNIKRNGYSYPVTTSFIGRGVPTKNVVAVSDYLLIHGNGAHKTALLQSLIDSTKTVLGKRIMPIVINEDDHYNFDKDTNNYRVALDNYVSWGYFDFRRKDELDYYEGYQSMPCDWGINSERKIQFFNMVAEVVGSAARKKYTPKPKEKTAIVIEAEATKSALQNWKLIDPKDANYVAGASGESYLEFLGNEPEMGDPNSPLTYEFTAPADGDYRLIMSASKRLEGERGDKCNDVWVKMDGDFKSACKLSEEDLRSYIKFFQEGSVNTPEKQWKWAYRGEKGHHVFFEFIYSLKKDQKYTLTLAGRSQRFSFDYLVLYDINKASLKDMMK
jgi:arabinoxylan arabinofuranohydrolase